MAMKQGQSWVIRDKVQFQFLVASKHHHVLEHAGSLLAGYPRQLIAVAVKMQRMNVIARIAKLEAIVAPLNQGVRRLHGSHGECLPIEGPSVESVERGVVLHDEHLNRFVGLSWCITLAELRVVPMEGPRFHSLWLALLSRVLDDNAAASKR